MFFPQCFNPIRLQYISAFEFSNFVFVTTEIQILDFFYNDFSIYIWNIFLYCVDFGIAFDPNKLSVTIVSLCNLHRTDFHLINKILSDYFCLRVKHMFTARPNTLYTTRSNTLYYSTDISSKTLQFFFLVW